MIFWKLALKEMKYQFKSVIFYVFILLGVMFYSSQYYEAVTMLQLPELDKVYTTVEATTEGDKLVAGYKDLYGVYLSGKVRKYIPISKNIKLNEVQLKDLENFLSKMAPGADVLKIEPDDIKISFEEMIAYMNKLDLSLGKNTSFGDVHRQFLRPLTYEEALVAYDKLKQDQNISNAYARLLSDYLGVYAAVFVVFLSAFSVLRDQYSGTQELIYGSKIKSIVYMGAKFVGLFISIMSLFLAIGLFETGVFLKKFIAYQMPINLFAFVHTIFAWVAPTVMFSIALSMFISIVVGNSLATIVVQTGAALFMVFSKGVVGEYGLDRFFIRYNTLLGEDYYQTVAASIACNRVFYVGLSIVLVIMTSIIWTIRRNSTVLGGFYDNKIRQCQ
ncbi:ABC transporter permease [Fusibacter ferrireducens]|uniref:ABC transporter permease n=1 Tax=Fusibacter ferrireducens TaxID=2785058 RepID=A0ABR9ZZT6_9FIRM|nr:hypothetical protein [Fusibacter ferrireducens]MBF4695506.1 hypothetical protein [Fusibacter ferrireducens]